MAREYVNINRRPLTSSGGFCYKSVEKLFAGHSSINTLRMPLDAQNKIVARMLDPLDYTVRREGTRSQSVSKFVYRLMMAGISLDVRLADNVMQSASSFNLHSMENFSRLMRIGVGDLSRGDT